MTWLSLLLIDLIYALQFILFMQWYYPKTIRISGCVPDFPIEHLIAILEIIFCFAITIFHVRKALKE